MIRFTAPIKTVSEANRMRGWKGRHFRFKAQKESIAGHMRQFGVPPTPPYIVSLTRIAPTRYPRRLDDDNLRSSLKGVRDAIATELGVDDGDTDRITFTYDQKIRGDHYAVDVEIARR